VRNKKGYNQELEMEKKKPQKKPVSKPIQPRTETPSNPVIPVPKVYFSARSTRLLLT